MEVYLKKIQRISSSFVLVFRSLCLRAVSSKNERFPMNALYWMTYVNVALYCGHPVPAKYSGCGRTKFTKLECDCLGDISSQNSS